MSVFSLSFMVQPANVLSKQEIQRRYSAPASTAKEQLRRILPPLCKSAQTASALCVESISPQFTKLFRSLWQKNFRATPVEVLEYRYLHFYQQKINFRDKTFSVVIDALSLATKSHFNFFFGEFLQKHFQNFRIE